ncbi:MAG: hypothetical protein P1V20_18050 [Verrucomicrobiales bacterium]|nr:hypothetical protein [Verrucomicrobiales bacterium]
MIQIILVFYPGLDYHPGIMSAQRFFQTLFLLAAAVLLQGCLGNEPPQAVSSMANMMPASGAAFASPTSD